MANETKASFLIELAKRYGSIRRLENSLSLYELGDGAARLYIRYSKVHGRQQTFYGLREEDLRQMEGHPSIICFLWDKQTEPLFVPFSDYEDVFQSTTPANDGQYKVQVYLKDDGTELYIAGAGRFNVEAYFGWDQVDSLLDSAKLTPSISYTHSQIQTLLGAIGVVKGHDIWIPPSDRGRLEWSLVRQRFDCRPQLPYDLDPIGAILQEVDVIWIEHGSSKIRALFEVEHSTPIYSGLLRFNDFHLIEPTLRPRFSIVSNEVRRGLFAKQINRPTFVTSGLADLCTFFEYSNVIGWHDRLARLGSLDN
jgi:hypothetical protein